MSRKTVQRWETGEAVPDAHAERAIAELVAERGAAGDGVPSPTELATALAAARVSRRRRQGPSGVLLGLSDDEATAPEGLFGRDEALALLDRALRVTRLVTLTGPGGVGKTALVRAHLDAIDRARDSAFVPLGAVYDASLVPGVIASHLGVVDTGRGGVRDAVVAALAERDLLLVIDNFEHVMWAAPFVGDLLAACPGVRVAVTSRRRLGLPGEHEMILRPLSASAGVQLFAARSGQPASKDAEEICARLDHLPLAIELVARRARSVPTAAWRARFRGPLRAAAGGGSTAPERHRALHTTLEWSYSLLSGSEQGAFRCLAAFAGPFATDAGAAVLPSGQDAALAGLVDNSLLTVNEKSSRYSMLATVREFAAEHLAAKNETASAHARHLAWYRQAVQRAARDLPAGPNQAGALAQIDLDYADIVVALQRAVEAGDADAALPIVASLAPWWDIRGRLGEGRTWATRSLQLDGGSPAARAVVTTWSGYLATLQGDYATAAALSEASEPLWAEAAFPAGVGYSLLVRGEAVLESGDSEAGADWLEQSLSIFRQFGDNWGEIRPLNSLAEVARAEGDFATAVRLHREAMAIAEAIGDRLAQPAIGAGLARGLYGAGRVSEATTVSASAVRAALSSGNPVQTAAALEAHALAKAPGDPGQAVRLWAAAAARRQSAGSPTEDREAAQLWPTIEDARAALGDAAFDQAWDTGSRLTDGEIVTATG